MSYTSEQIKSMSDDKLYFLSRQKRKNGNGTSDAYKAQRELFNRTGGYSMRGYRNGSTRQYAANQDYMEYECDNR